MKRTNQEPTQTQKPTHSENLPPEICRIHEAVTARGALEIASDETKKAIRRRQEVAKEGRELLKKERPDLVHLVK